MDNGLIQSSHFDSSNPLCPITLVQLSDGVQYFDLVGQDSTFVQSSESTQAADQFEVRLKQTYISAENTYDYEVSALALGGATAVQQGAMTVTPPEYDCSSATLRSLEDSYEYDIPMPGLEFNYIIL